MEILFYVLIVLFILLSLYVAMIFNHLVVLKHSVRKAWANIDVLLKQRHDELPKLVEICKRYMQHEQQTLEKVMLARGAVSGARTAHDVDALGSAETAMRAGLGDLFALVENYPELKANENFLGLQQRITQLESSIADRREFYNETVVNNNIRIEQFPDTLIAGIFGFKEAQLLEFADEELADVDLKALFGS